ncbi:hypothetical protein Vretimale_17400 [Volvox reticuliferus]|uniref:Uncharacterized protein n=1 Tax=Volvox reticuliferus TaxID=1737510 RepID=A0A8J4C0D9_9CHLO|nr:hypothetical protein Vretifemale_2 [Volvox reticuliferus]GIM14454.1 hypothetical protein Vretimale_17400 [Volvox reticuliferus]
MSFCRFCNIGRSLWMSFRIDAILGTSAAKLLAVRPQLLDRSTAVSFRGPEDDRALATAAVSSKVPMSGHMAEARGCPGTSCNCSGMVSRTQEKTVPSDLYMS